MKKLPLFSLIRRLPRRFTRWLIALTLISLVTYHFRFHLYSRADYTSLTDLADFIDTPIGSGPLWKGTPYIGDQNGESLFLDQTFNTTILSIPAASWDPPKRFELTRDQSQWIEWHDLRPTIKMGSQ